MYQIWKKKASRFLIRWKSYRERHDMKMDIQLKIPAPTTQNYSDPKHNLHPIEVPMDAIEVRVYFINVCVYFVKGHFYLTKTGVYSAFFYLINF